MSSTSHEHKTTWEMAADEFTKRNMKEISSVSLGICVINQAG